MPRPDRPPVDLVFHTKSGSGRRNPPSVNAQYTAIDTGNATPRHIRCTTAAPPCTKDLLNQTGLPLAIHATPFAPVDVTAGEEPIPVVDFLGESPPRCNNPKCCAYVNPQVVWTDNGRTWTCNLCGRGGNVVPEWYYAPIDSVSGLRVDRNHRPELVRGSVDYVVGDEYAITTAQVGIIM